MSKFKSSVKIGNRLIGSGTNCFVVAEISANHNHDFDTAVKLIKAAKKSGADAIKLQTYTPDTITLNINRGNFKIPKTNQLAGYKNLYELYQQLYTPWDWQPKLKQVADSVDLLLYSSVFDATAVDFMEKYVQPPAYKIASFELIDHGLLKKVAATKKPVILSTGLASLQEIAEAINVLHQSGCRQLILMRCASSYPAQPQELNLNLIPQLQQTFNLPVGLSDHALGIATSLAAIALGAVSVEKHFTLDKHQPGADHSFSIDPRELKHLVIGAKQIRQALGDGQFDKFSPTELANQRLYRRSLYFTRNLKAGQQITPSNVKSVRPGGGLTPKYLPIIQGLKVKRSLTKGTPVSWELIK